MTLKEKISHLKAINIEMLFNEILRSNEETLVKMNQSQLYDEGVIDVTAPSKKEHYSPATIRQKKRSAKYSKVEFVTLRWAGNFYEGMKLLIFKDKFVITSKDLKWANFLEANKRFGNALGMTEENKGKLRDITRDAILKRMRNEL